MQIIHISVLRSNINFGLRCYKNGCSRTQCKNEGNRNLLEVKVYLILINLIQIHLNSGMFFCSLQITQDKVFKARLASCYLISTEGYYWKDLEQHKPGRT